MNITTSLPTVNDILNLWQSNQKIEYLENLLRSTNRKGIENIITYIKESDFYIAPSSASYHSNYSGGLLDHSILVYLTAVRYRKAVIEMRPELEALLPEESIIICTLLHDLCKTNFYKQVIKYRKDENNTWQSYVGYEIDDKFPIGHGEKTVIMLQNFGLELSAEEMLAIRYHMGSWDGALFTNDVKYAYGKAIDMCPMINLIQSADNTSSLLFEKKIN